ncbi:hypothetical protein [Sideroxydans sp. CL21]|nr:hypothetical protein [Sideroxydans sp. CL21]
MDFITNSQSFVGHSEPPIPQKLIKLIIFFAKKQKDRADK